MLKTFRHLLDEIDVARHNLAAYPDPEEGLEGAGKREYYEAKLDTAYEAVESLVDRFEAAAERRADKESDTPNVELLAVRQAEANKPAVADEAPVDEGGGATKSAAKAQSPSSATGDKK